MTNIFHTIRQIMSGVRPLDDKIKYPMIAYMLALVHASFAILFYHVPVTPLVFYNIGVTVFYMAIGMILIKTKHHVPVFIAILFEIMFNSIMSTVMLGWDWGFMMYTVGLIPLIFYLMYTLMYFKGSIIVPMVSSAVVMACYYTMRIVMSNINPLYQLNDAEDMESFFYYYNITLTFVILYFCSVLFSIEVYYMRKNLERENRNLGEIANYDPLTHLMNRRSMMPKVKQAFAKAKEGDFKFCLIMGDIDDFKSVNDTYGHACGDTLLVTVANLIKNCVREEDCVCRWGGEEFLLLIQADREISTQVAKRICEDVSKLVIEHENIKLSVTMTLGVAEYDGQQSSRVMIDLADQRMYYGKKNGKNQVVN